MRLSDIGAKIIFSTATLLLLALSISLYQQISHLLRAEAQQNEATVIKLQLDKTLIALQEAESAQRGFLLTQDSAFLQPYEGAYHRSKNLLGELRKHTVASTAHQNDLNTLQTFIEVRFKTFYHVIHHYNDPRIDGTTREQHLLRGNAAMDSIRYYMQRIADREDETSKRIKKAERQYQFFTPLLAVLLMMAAIAILAYSYSNIIRHLHRTKNLLWRLNKLNNRLKGKNYELELYNKELDSFTYIASHDLKEPLRKILTNLSMLDASGQETRSASDRHYLQKIGQSACRMQQLLNDLLLYSHLNGGEKPFEAVDLNKVIAEIHENLQEEISETGARICSAGLPVINGLYFQIKQLFENLVSNALKYRQEGRRPVIVIEAVLVERKTIAEKFPKNSAWYYKIDVSDNGQGFNQAYAHKAFQLFQRLDVDPAKPGTGIGLTICKKIVDNHHGLIKVSSEEKQGTRFEIYLPAPLVKKSSGFGVLPSPSTAAQDKLRSG